MDPMTFLCNHAPFDGLSDSGLERLAAVLEVTYAAGGERLVTQGTPNQHLFVVRQGAVRLELDGQRVDDLGEGEVFGLSCLAGDTPARFDAVAEGDGLIYRLPSARVRALFDDEPGFAAFFLAGLGERLRTLTEGSLVGLGGGAMATPVGDLTTRPPVTVGWRATVGEAAETMRRERVSSVLVRPEEGGEAARPVGILTDRDLRSRVLAEGRGPETAVAEVLSQPLATAEATVPVSEGVLTMLQRRIHHLPITRGGAVVGVVTHTDLMHHQQQSPAALLRAIQRAPDPRALDDYAEQVAEMVASLERSGLAATDVGRMVAALGDALLNRLLDRAEVDLGPPPRPYAWIVHGSEGRQEQSLLTDQDNALVYEGPTVPPDHEVARYFAGLAERVVADLVAVGFPPCAGGFMATHWNGSLPEWVEHFRGWAAEPEPEALLRVANFFDFRKVHGALDLEPLEAEVALASRDQLFLAQLARAAMTLRPPLGILRRIREDTEGVDLKAGAIVPIVSLARLLALEGGTRRGSTLARLAAARRAGALSEEGEEVLREAFRFVFALRLRQQLADRRGGRPFSHRIRLAELGALERRHLKEAFLAVRRMQQVTTERLATDRLG